MTTKIREENGYLEVETSFGHSTFTKDGECIINNGKIDADVKGNEVTFFNGVDEMVSYNQVTGEIRHSSADPVERHCSMGDRRE